MRLFPRILRALFVGALFVLLSAPLVSAENHSHILENMRMSNVTIDSLQYLAEHQDKTTGGIFEEGSTEPDDGVTAWSAIAFAAAGYDPESISVDGSPSIIDYINSRACTYKTATDIERTVLALSAADYDINKISNCDLVSKLDTYKNDDWSVGPDIVSTIFGALAYSSIDVDIDQKTIDYIVSQQQENGGWNDGYSIETQITSQAIMALAASGFDANSDVITSAKNYIKSEQTELGGIKYTSLSDWPATDSDSWSNAYALQAINSLGEDPSNEFWLANGLSIIEDTASFKKDDSSYLYSRDQWGDSTPVWTTAVVIPALAGKPLGFAGNDLMNFSDDLSADDPNESTEGSISEETISTDSSSSSDTTQSSNSENSQSVKSTSTVIDSTKSTPVDNNIEITDEEVEVDPQVLATINENDDLNLNNLNTITIILICVAGLVFGALMSVCTKRLLPIILIVIVITLASPAMAHAGRAGVVVRYSDGRQTEQCVTFDEDYISGYELLRRAGLSPVLDRNFIVGISGESGKAFDSAGASSFYWSYWQLDNSDNWEYSHAGATYSKIHDGAIDGWQLGDSTLKLSAVNFDAVCPTVTQADTTDSQTSIDSANSSDTSISTSSDNSQNNQDIESNNNNDSTVAQKQSDQITEDNNQEIASVKGASTTAYNNTTDQTKMIIYIILVFSASVTVGFLVHRVISKSWRNRQ